MITGISGQDGSYLAELLLASGYEVHGLVRRVAMENPSIRLARLGAIRDQVQLHSASIENYASVFKIFAENQFDECYHLAAQSFVAESFVDGFSTMNINVNGTHFVLESIRQTQPSCRFYFAGSSEMFGRVEEVPQRETTRFHPRSVYGISKCTGFELTRNYREAYDMFCCSGILFNHESPRRGFEFVTRRITDGVARICHGLADSLSLGNLEARRDWGHAKDYVRAMHLMLQQETPDDFVVATGKTHSVRDLCEQAFSLVDRDYRDYVNIDENLFRPAEVDLLIGDPTRAKVELGWTPEYSFEQLLAEMVEADLARAESEHPA